MNNSLIDHPTEDALIEHAFDADKEDIMDHVDSCEQCAETITEFREIKEALLSMPEEDLPATLSRKILGHSRGGDKKQLNLLSVVQMMRSPFVIGMGIVALVLFLYFLFMFIC